MHIIWQGSKHKIDSPLNLIISALPFYRDLLDASAIQYLAVKGRKLEAVLEMDNI